MALLEGEYINTLTLAELTSFTVITWSESSPPNLSLFKVKDDK